MMTSVAQSYSPHPAGLQQHPGVAQGHPMSGVLPQQGGPPGPGMPQQAFHMGVSGPGVQQASQTGAMMAGIPPGLNGPGGPNAHALQHLNPNQALYQQQQQQQQMACTYSFPVCWAHFLFLVFYGSILIGRLGSLLIWSAVANPQMQQMAQQHILQQQTQARQAQAARQAMMAQQYNGGMPMNMVNGMNPGLNAAQFAAMRQAVPRMQPVPLPQHLQQQQAQAQISLEQQQVQAQQHQQHQVCL